MAFQAGDIVRYKLGQTGHAPDGLNDSKFIIKCVSGGMYYLQDKGSKQEGNKCSCVGNHNWVAHDYQLELAYGIVSSVPTMYADEIAIKPKSKTMSITERFKVALLPEPAKTFRKAGITNGDNMLTMEGTQILLAWLLEKNGDAFKTEVVDGLLAEQLAEKD